MNCPLLVIVLAFTGSLAVEKGPVKPSFEPMVKAGNYVRSSDSGAHCGIYSFCAMVKAMGHDVSPSTFLSNEFIGQSGGSSASELIAAAARIGIEANAYQSMSVTDLRRSKVPMILRLKRRAENSFHWVTFLGEKDGCALIFDAPRPVERVEYAQIMAAWTGVAVVPSGPGKRLVSSLTSRFFSSREILLIALVMIGLSFSFVNRLNGKGQVTVLLLIASVAALTYHRFSHIGFLDNQLAVATTERGYAEYSPPELTLEELAQRQTHGTVQLVDARVPDDFTLGHIPGAYNLPVDASLGELRDRLEGLDLQRQIIVYCQSSSCSWDSDVASLLVGMGAADVAIFEGGYMRWQAQQSTTQPLPEPVAGQLNSTPRD